MKDERGEMIVDGQRLSYSVRRSARRRKTLGFEFESPDHVRVVAPMRATRASVLKVLEKQSNWIRLRLAQRNRDTVTAPRKISHDYGEDGRVTYLGHMLKIDVTHDAAVPQTCRVLPRRMIVNLHEQMDGADREEAVRLEIRPLAQANAPGKNSINAPPIGRNGLA